jgi:putative MATE family efflux protein
MERMFSRRDLWRLILPLVIEQLLAVTIGMADTVMVASVGEAAVSGISLVDSVNILLINIFSALATGGAIIAAQYIGREDRENACAAAKQLLLASTAVSLVIMAGCMFFQRPLLTLIFGQIEPLVMDNANTYFFLSALSYPFLAVYNSGAALFRSMNNSKISMVTSVGMNLINIAGNALTIYGFHMGVTGAGLSSLISRAAGAAAMLVLLQNPHNLIHIEHIWKPELRPRMIRNILQIGIPNGLENGMFQIGKILVQSLIASFGTAAIAANAVASSVASLAQIPGGAIGLGMITVVGQCVGARDYRQARSYTLKLTGVSYASLIAMNLISLVLLDPLIGMYNLSPEGMELARLILLWQIGVSSALWPASFTLPNGLRAANDVKFTMLVSIFSMWVFRIGFSYLLAQWLQMGLLGVWLAMYVDWAVRIVFFLFRFFRGRWMNKQII